ncbi:SRPBCC domain-containing protein [Yoonia sp. SS1-5]|uniref:SRPBCC domain-containing protein n=1 Tax=Yoonia rhodophyticola TaxID=3137370 RepID=A0AAN0NK20_9RHOB
MTPYHVTRDIAAPPETVWSILTDANRLSDGSFSIIRIDGRIAAGQSFKLWSTVDPKRAFPIKVAVMQPAQRMEWHGGMPLGLFLGNRQFSLTPIGTGTRFDMRETYSGPLKGLITRFIPDLQPSFETFANALKAAAEDTP